MITAFLTILIPMAGAFTILILPKKNKPVCSVALLAATFATALLTIPAVLNFKELTFTKYVTDMISISFTADGLAVFMASVSSFVALLISFYSLDYMRDYEDRGKFYFWMLLFIGAMMGLIFSSNLMLMFCFWEITSVCSWRLIGFYRKDPDVKAADKAFLITFLGASIMLAGIVLVYLKYGTLDLALLKGKGITDLAAFLIFTGVISKSAQLPLQTWLPDAGVAPTPVTSLLHAAVLVKIGVYAFARLYCFTFLTTQFFFNFTIALSVATIIVAAGSALRENNMKRILAYSTISQLGYIFLALSLNIGISFNIALIYILAHSLAKAGLFLCAGIVEHTMKTKDINELGGLYKYMPYTATAYLLCAFSIIGIPPFLGFWPKFMTVLLALNSGHAAAGCLAVVGAVMTLLYLMRLYNKVFLGNERPGAKAEDRNSPMVRVVVILGVLSLISGFMIKPIFDLVRRL